MDDQGATGTVADARRLFEAELHRRGMRFRRLDDGRYEVERDEGSLTLSLENAARDFVRDGDAGAIARFVERSFRPTVIAGWEAAAGHVYFSAERADQEFGDTLHIPITDTVTRVLVVTSPEEEIITWLTPRLIATWNVTLAQLEAAAAADLDWLLAGKQLEVAEADGKRLGMLPVDSALKASLIFAPGLRRFIEPQLGWPVFAVVPCRDFVYLIAERDQELLNNLGTVVQREFRESGYPLTTEVLRISSDGIEAIGAFPE